MFFVQITPVYLENEWYTEITKKPTSSCKNFNIMWEPWGTDISHLQARLLSYESGYFGDWIVCLVMSSPASHSMLGNCE